jgi:precorrin-6B methylase 2
VDVTAPTSLITEWAWLWRRLVERGSWGACTRAGDPWADRAAEFDARLAQRWTRPHPLRDNVTARIIPGSTVLDIGAGTGAWAAHLARTARSVTALDCSPAMLAVLRANLARAGVANVHVVQGRWPDLTLDLHDYSLCSHGMYGTADLPRFVQRMIETTRRTCFLIIRASAANGLMAEAAQHLWGNRMDSPNFTIAYNILLQMGLTPNVTVDPTPWDPPTSPDLSSAVNTIKDRLGLDDGNHDAFLLDLVLRRLQRRGAAYVWPADLRSVLLYWDTA